MEYVIRIIRFPRLTVDALVRPVVLGWEHIRDHFIPHPRNNYHPHILGHRALALFSVLLVSVKIFTLAVLSVGPILPAFSSAITQENIFILANESRKAYNLRALVYNNSLAKAAQTKADDMLARGYFSHNTPDGKTPWSFIESANYNYIMAGENLAVNFTQAESVEAAWMNSPGHKANILNKNFEEIGIGVSQGDYQGHEAIFVAQMFGAPAEQKITLSDAPTIVQTQSAHAAPATEVKIAPAAEGLAATADSSADKVLAAPMLEAVKIISADINLAGSQVKITARVSSSAVKVIAYFGRQAAMLSPKSDGVWQADIPVNILAAGKQTVNIRVYNLSGQTAEMKLADFAGSTIENFNVLGAQSQPKVSFWGRAFDLKTYEQKFYLLFIAAILASLILAIAIKRHIQHISLVANTSFVVILAVLLWTAG